MFLNFRARRCSLRFDFFDDVLFFFLISVCFKRFLRCRRIQMRLKLYSLGCTMYIEIRKKELLFKEGRETRSDTSQPNVWLSMNIQN